MLFRPYFDCLRLLAVLTLVVTSATFAQTINTVTVTSSGNVGDYTSLALVNGNPAISYYDWTNFQIKYVRASNAAGTLWSPPVTMPVILVSGQTSTLLVVNGNPAVAYQDGGNGFMKYIRAADTSGTTWGSALSLASSVESGLPCQMAVVAARPAICFSTQLSGNKRYLRASDATGSTWGTTYNIPGVSSSSDISLADVGGLPALAFTNGSNYLSFMRASSVDGSAWTSAGTLNSVTTGDPCLAIVNGNPAIAYLDAVNDDLRFIRASSATGASWNSSVALDTTGRVGWNPSLGVVNGKPCVAYYDVTNGDLKLVRAVDADGTVWANPVVIASAGDQGEGCSLMALGTQVAISYYDYTNGDLKWSVYTPPPDEPDIAMYGNGAVSITSGDTTPSTTDGTSFGSADVSTGSVTATFSIENRGFTTLTLSDTPVVRITGPNAADFTVVNIPPASYAPAASAFIQVVFDPTGPGTRTATVTIASNDPDEATFTFAIEGTGTGTTASPEISVSGNGVGIVSLIGTASTANGTNFGTVPVGNGIVTQTYVVTNIGNAPLNLTGATRVTVTGTNASDFSVISFPIGALAAGESSSFQVVFDPTATGARSAQINIANDDGNESSFSFAVAGTASGSTAAPEIALRGNSIQIISGDTTPSSADFTDFGSVSAASGTIVRTFTIANLGGATLNISGTPKVAVSGTNAADFVVTTLPAATVAAAGTTTFQVTFDPGAEGFRTAILTIPNNDTDEAAYTFAIQGFGTGVPNPALDSAFGVSGMRLFSDPAFSLRVQDVALAADGSIFVLAAARNLSTPAVRGMVMKLSSTGTVDSAFGSRLVSASPDFYPRALAVASDGSLRVAGHSGNNFIVVSMSSAGAVVSTWQASVGTNASLRAMTLQSDGKILLLGSSSQLNGSGNPTGYSNMRLVRLTSAGALDTAFGTSGVVTISAPSALKEGTCMAIDASGAIVVAGVSGAVDQPRCQVLRVLGSNGALDTTFDTDGSLTLSTLGAPVGIIVQADNKIAVLGARFSASGFALVRLNASGTIDATIGGTGIVEDSVGVTEDAVAGLAYRSSDGRFFVANTAFNGTSSDFNLLRLKPDGTRDIAFDGDGSAAASVGLDFDTVSGLKLQSDGKVLLFGSAIATPMPSPTSLAVARFQPGTTQTNAAPTITTPPASITVNRGSPATFTVTVNSTVTPVYTWFRNGTPLSVPNSSSLTLPSAQLADEGSYTVSVATAHGTATSTPATLTVVAPPVIDSQPLNVNQPGGSNAVFSVVTSGRSPFTYLWQKDGADMNTVDNPSAATANLNVLVDDSNEGSYRVLVTNTDGNVTSAAATLVSVANAPVITAQPQSAGVVTNASVTLNITATGRSPFTFQWQKGTTNVGTPVTQPSGTFSLTVQGQTTNAGAYHCIVTNADGSVTSNDATVTVYSSGTVLMTPVDLLISDNEPITLAVDLFHTTLVTRGYQWQKDTKNITGETQRTFTRAHGTFTDGGLYRCVLTTSGTPVTGPNVRLGVVESAPRNVIAAATKPVTITAKTVGTGLTYAWQNASGVLHNGGRISGADKASLVITGVTAATDAGVYRCVVSGWGQTKTTGDITLVVEADRPVVSPVTFSNLRVGREASIQLSASHNPTSFSVVGLPAGLTYNTVTGLITGAPTAAGTFSIKITATNPVGPSPTLTVPMVVAPLDTSLVAVYNGLIGSGVSGWLGTITLTTSTTGLYTGRFTISESNGKSFVGIISGKFKEVVGEAGHYSSVSAPIAVPAAFQGTFSNTCYINLDWDGSQLTGTLSGEEDGPGFDGDLVLKRNPWNAIKKPATEFAGYFTTALERDLLNADLTKGCSGSGYGSFTVATGGTFTFAGKLPDGTAVSMATYIDENGAATVHTWLAGYTGYLAGTMRLIAGHPPNYYDTGVQGALQWNRSPLFTKFTLDAGTNDYLEGFWRQLIVRGARYIAPNVGLTTGPLLFDATLGSGNLSVITSSGVLDYDLVNKSPMTGSSNTSTCTLGANGAITVPPLTTGDSIQLKSLVVSGPTGLITGTASRLYWNEDPDTAMPTTIKSSIPISFQAMASRPDPSKTASVGQGFFVNSAVLSLTNPETSAQVLQATPFTGEITIAAPAAVGP